MLLIAPPMLRAAAAMMPSVAAATPALISLPYMSLRRYVMSIRHAADAALPPLSFASRRRRRR